MITMLLLICTAPQMINTSNEAWNTKDYKTLQISQKRCKQLYPEAPCVKLFHKTEPRVYRVLCKGQKSGNTTILND